MICNCNEPIVVVVHYDKPSGPSCFTETKVHWDLRSDDDPLKNLPNMKVEYR